MFEVKIPAYYREKTVYRAAGDMRWHLAMQALGLPDDNLADEEKERVCLRLSDAIEDVCYDALELGILSLRRLSAHHLRSPALILFMVEMPMSGYDESTQKTPAQTIRRFIRAKEYGKKFLGYSERKDQGRGSG